MARRMRNEMPDEAKDFAVLCFARFMTPTQVAEAVNERFGTDARPQLLDKRTAQLYDPMTKRGQELGKKRKALFAQLRANVIAELEEIPIANRSMRLHQLQRHYEKAVQSDKVSVALGILEQAAKEAGGVHTNERTVNLKGKVQFEDVTEDEMRSSIAAAIAFALQERRDKLAPPAVH